MKAIDTILAIPADTHWGSSGALMLPKWQNVYGNPILQNNIQKKIYEQWRECWDIVRKMRKGKRLIIVHDGDAVEGLHHGNRELTSIRPDEQERMHIAGMQEIKKECHWNEDIDKIFYVGGTEAHVQVGAVSEEKIARDLGAVPFIEPDENIEEGLFVWWKWRKRINLVPFDIGHVGTTPGIRVWLRGNNVRYEIKSLYFECLENQIEIPRYFVRAHRHVWIEPEKWGGEAGTIEGFLLPSFQAIPELSWVANRHIFAHIGMLIFQIDKNGKSDWICPRIKLANDEIEDL